MNRVLTTALAAGLAATAFTAPAFAKAGDWIFRARAIMVAPTDKGNNGPVRPNLTDYSADVTTAYTPEIDITYMVTDNIGVELIAATAKHSAKLAAFRNLGGPLEGAKAADTWVLPPTLTVQYHFNPEGAYRPYIGLGLNYTMFYAERASETLKGVTGAGTKVGIDDSVGYSVQAGIDIPINETFFINLDVKYIQIDTKARFKNMAIPNQTVKIDLDPIVAGIGVGMRF
jgi:outer membrane protein